VTSRDPRAALRAAGLRPKKSFGQNFLVAEPIARAIAEACVPSADVGRACVVEIGAGTGVLTRLLAARARLLVAVERDRDLLAVLAGQLEGFPHARVLAADARSVDLAELLGARRSDSPRVLCGNLPYAISGPMLRRTVEVADGVDRVVFMLQDEVVRRLAATPGSKAWGALTVFVRAAYDVRRLLRAPPGAFHPPPKVTSAVVELLPLRPPRARETPLFRSLVRGAFEARRKTLRNAWAGLAPSAEALEEAATAAGVALTARGETLDVESFAQMASALESVSAPRR
jgi:16S rRNA (adenine1518-N6/adenine1519-N6)-dimethyltransferase